MLCGVWEGNQLLNKYKSWLVYISLYKCSQTVQISIYNEINLENTCILHNA